MATIKSIEEKAKRYDEAIERAEKALEVLGTDKCEGARQIFSLFPEFEESEDEKIRKFLIQMAQNGHGGNKDWWNKCVAWLEKQGEQKPADKVAPKFKVGDWIANDYCAGKVMALTDDAYLLDTGQGIPFSCEHNAHLWKIKDAKPGDVLAAHECLVLFREIDGLNIRCYCTYHFMNNPSFYVDTLQNKEAFHPATKEQEDQLKKAMADAGYTFDFDKKELKKIEHDVQLTEFEEAVKDLMNDYREAIGDNDATVEEVKEHAAYMLSLIHQNPAWSEEDETALCDALWCCKQAASIAKDENDMGNVWYAERWLKSFKDRFGCEVN